MILIEILGLIVLVAIVYFGGKKVIEIAQKGSK